ncbi:ASCH domain-containing protein [Vagococcus sp. WN89Y]|uniref:ASCH domain-containing protein n=1 Tax=Vagococcus sp. WN89Y TaxID=3457258 RepID=UPI003FCD98FB
MVSVEYLQTKYPGAQAWAFGDSPELANELAELVSKGLKTASCGSLVSYLSENNPPSVGSFHIILDGQQKPVCVIRLISLQLMKFSEVTEDFARKEGEGDLSLAYWQNAHRAFFSREGTFAEDMELVGEEFRLVSLCTPENTL